MKLSKRQTQLMHAAVIGFVTGVLTAIQVAIAVGHLSEKGALLSALVGVLTGGISKAAGGLLAAIQTTDHTPGP